MVKYVINVTAKDIREGGLASAHGTKGCGVARAMHRHEIFKNYSVGYSLAWDYVTYGPIIELPKHIKPKIENIIRRKPQKPFKFTIEI